MRLGSKREQFYREVSEAMSMNGMRSFIDLQTLRVEIHPGTDSLFLDEKDPAEEVLNNPDRFLPVEAIRSSESYQIMVDFAEGLKEKKTQTKLIQALEGKKPFANFKVVTDNSPVKQAWFDFRDNAYIGIAKQWIDNNAPDELKEKVKSLPAVFVV